MPDGPDELAELERRRAELYAELGQVGDFRRGSLNEVRRKCGKPNCACAAPDHPGHGPQWNLTRKADGRTRTVHLRPGPELEQGPPRGRGARAVPGPGRPGHGGERGDLPGPPGRAGRRRRGFPSRDGRGKGGLRDALAAEQAAELGRLAAEAARAMGCGDAGLEAAEAVIRAGLLRLGGSMLEQLLAADRGHRGPRVPCGRGHEAEFVSYRDKLIDTVLGPVALTRAWYHCAECGHGLAPRDAELGVAGEGMSPGLAAMNDRAAAAVPFAQAAEPAGGPGRGPADRQARRAGGRGQRRRPGRRRAGARPAHRRQETGAAPALTAAGQALRGHRRHRRPHDLHGKQRAGTGRARTAAPAPARSSSPSSSPRTGWTRTATRSGTGTPPASSPPSSPPPSSASS